MCELAHRRMKEGQLSKTWSNGYSAGNTYSSDWQQAERKKKNARAICLIAINRRQADLERGNATSKRCNRGKPKI